MFGVFSQDRQPPGLPSIVLVAKLSMSSRRSSQHQLPFPPQDATNSTHHDHRYYRTNCIFLVTTTRRTRSAVIAALALAFIKMRPVISASTRTINKSKQQAAASQQGCRPRRGQNDSHSLLRLGLFCPPAMMGCLHLYYYECIASYRKQCCSFLALCG